MSEDNFLITDHGGITNFKFLASGGTIKYGMSLETCDGYDITCVDEKHVAITSGHSQQSFGFEIVNIEKRRRVKFIKLPSNSYGITCNRDSLYVCVHERGIYKVNTVNYTKTHVISCNLSRYSYVSTFADKIYYTDNNEEEVVCCYLNGSPCWTFKDDSVLKWPRGITVDTNGNVFVVGQESSNVVLLSNDGKYNKEILSKKDGLQEPSAISSDKQKRELLVANLKQKVFLYNIT